MFGRKFGKALMTAIGRSLGTERFVEFAQHVAIGIANRQELVEGQNYAGFRQYAACKSQKIDAQQQEMVKMHDVRLKELEKFAKGFSQIDTCVLVPQIVVAATQVNEFALSSIEAGDLSAGFVEDERRRIDRGQQGGLDTFTSLKRSKQLVTDLLRAAANQLWVIEADQ